MAEVLAAGIAGGSASQFVQPLKATNGEPHNLGQYYILIDPLYLLDLYSLEIYYRIQNLKN